jgi:hypothetical protein
MYLYLCVILMENGLRILRVVCVFILLGDVEVV